MLPEAVREHFIFSAVSFLRGIPLHISPTTIRFTATRFSTRAAEGSGVKSPHHSCRGPNVGSQHPQWVAHNLLNSSSGESDTLFWPPWVPGKHVVHRHTGRENTITHEIKGKIKREREVCGLIWGPAISLKKEEPADSHYSIDHTKPLKENQEPTTKKTLENLKKSSGSSSSIRE